MISQRLDLSQPRPATSSTTINVNITIPERMADALMQLLNATLHQQHWFPPETTRTGNHAMPGDGSAKPAADSESGHGIADTNPARPDPIPEPPTTDGTGSESLLAETPDSEVSETPDFERLYFSRVLPDVIDLEASSAMKSQIRTGVTHFGDWWRKKNLRSVGPKVLDLESSPNLVAEFYDFQLKSKSPSTAKNTASGLAAAWEAMHDLQLISVAPIAPKWKKIRKRNSIEQTESFPVPVSPAELSTIFQVIIELQDEFDFPNLAGIDNFEFLWNVFAVCAIHGIRPGDFWAIQTRHGKGLLKSEFCRSPAPPIRGGELLECRWDFGWLNLRMNKTGKRLVSPVCPQLRWLADRCWNLDPAGEAVFPIACSNKGWYRQIHRILARCGFDRPVSLCGAAPHASFRKYAACMFSEHGGDAMASFMLGHASRLGSAGEVGVSAITKEHYSKSTMFPKACDALALVMANQVAEIRVPLPIPPT